MVVGRMAGRRWALAIDVGTGTQDVLLFDTGREIENAVRLVLPSPTAIMADRIRAATLARRPLLLGGALMGGGPIAWAARDHAAAGLFLAATPAAASTIDDDLAAVERLGVRIVEEAGVDSFIGGTAAERLELRDVWLTELAAALAMFDVDLAAVDALAVAVFDHGAAPPGVSDRRFRFDRLRERLAADGSAGPAAFAYLAEEVPAAFTRLATAASAARAWLDEHGRHDAPVLVMDTGPAAILGALDDAAARRALAAGVPLVAVNIGNFHTLAMRLEAAAQGPRITAIFEHHTGELSRPQLARFLRQLVGGTIDDQEVFRSQGHGALVLPPSATARAAAGRRAHTRFILTGPRRSLLAGRVVRGLGRPSLAVPHGDMMQAGPFGLLRALATKRPSWREAVTQRLG
jgi:uncharacterized protein (DUF1786 family)